MNDQASRVVALDVGKVRVGIAASDPGRILATPRGVLPFSPPGIFAVELPIFLGEDWFEVEDLVIGLPLSLSGEDNDAVRLIRAWGEQLGGMLGLGVHFFDERFSTTEAWRLLRERGLDGRSGKDKVDGAAAALILEAWLASSG